MLILIITVVLSPLQSVLAVRNLFYGLTLRGLCTLKSIFFLIFFFFHILYFKYVHIHTLKAKIKKK